MGEEMSAPGLAQVFVDMQVKKPGLWDGKMVNYQGEHYFEAKHGLNPLEQGYSICAPVQTQQSVRRLSELKKCDAGPT
jgi:hypothetical protein